MPRFPSRCRRYLRGVVVVVVVVALAGFGAGWARATGTSSVAPSATAVVREVKERMGLASYATAFFISTRQSVGVRSPRKQAAEGGTDARLDRGLPEGCDAGGSRRHAGGLGANRGRSG